jgi:hypothetical protein
MCAAGCHCQPSSRSVLTPQAVDVFRVVPRSRTSRRVQLSLSVPLQRSHPPAAARRARCAACTRAAWAPTPSRRCTAWRDAGRVKPTSSCRRASVRTCPARPPAPSARALRQGQLPAVRQAAVAAESTGRAAASAPAARARRAVTPACACWANLASAPSTVSGRPLKGLRSAPQHAVLSARGLGFKVSLPWCGVVLPCDTADSVSPQQEVAFCRGVPLIRSTRLARVPSRCVQSPSTTTSACGASRKRSPPRTGWCPRRR